MDVHTLTSLHGNAGWSSRWFVPFLSKFSPGTSQLSFLSKWNSNLMSQLFASCWPITNEWLLGSFWTLHAQCCWWGVAFPKHALQHSGCQQFVSLYRGKSLFYLTSWSQDLGIQTSDSVDCTSAYFNLLKSWGWMLEQRMELDVMLVKSTVGIYILQVKLFTQVSVYT